MTSRRVRPAERFALVAIAKDAATAEGWQRALADAGIQAEIRITEPERAGIPSSTRVPIGVAGNTTMFAYALHVDRHDQRAARALIAAQPDVGPMPVNRTALIGATVVVGLTMLLVVALVLRG